MRLINTETLRMEEFLDAEAPPYAILSHTWERGEEVSYHEMRTLTAEVKAKSGFDKIQNTCRIARSRDLGYAWIDTCCIDKSSSAELQESINSMYAWYGQARVCYTYLTDFPATSVQISDESCHYAIEPSDWYNRMDKSSRKSQNNFDLSLDSTTWRSDTSKGDEFYKSHKAFRDCNWFTRGWTLQELIAPKELIFFGKQWNPIGSKAGLLKSLSAITRIPASVLGHKRPLTAISVASRMSWAAERKTTRVEDRAYSLLGIFGLSMPMSVGSTSDMLSGRSASAASR